MGTAPTLWPAGTDPKVGNRRRDRRLLRLESEHGEHRRVALLSQFGRIDVLEPYGPYVTQDHRRRPAMRTKSALRADLTDKERKILADVERYHRHPVPSA